VVVSRDPESFVIDVGYRDPTDDDPAPERERPSPDDAVLDPLPVASTPIRELTRAQLERELAFGNGIRQVLARDELSRRAGDGYQPPLFGPLTARSPR
jgi:hypothetical protein